jgi:hypothetical protein
MGRLAEGGASDDGSEWGHDRNDYAELALSEWGRWDDELDAFSLACLTRAYARRKQWESKLVAGELAQVMAAAMGGGSSTGTTRTVGGKPTRQTSADALMMNMGVRL